MQSTVNWYWEFQQISAINPFPYFHRVGLHNHLWENDIRLRHEARIPNEMDNNAHSLPPSRPESSELPQKSMATKIPSIVLVKGTIPWTAKSLPLNPIIHKFLCVIHSYSYPPLTYYTLTLFSPHYHWLLSLTFTFKQVVLTDFCKFPLIYEMESC